MSNICCFAGHSDLYGTDAIYEKLLRIIENFVTVNGINEFWVGNYGDFDKLSAKAVRQIKTKHPQVQINLVIPYLTSELNNYKELYINSYDNILVADIPQSTPKFLQIIKTNQYMINNSDILVCYVSHTFGGAAKTLEYAKRMKNISIINIVV